MGAMLGPTGSRHVHVVPVAFQVVAREQRGQTGQRVSCRESAGQVPKFLVQEDGARVQLAWSVPGMPKSMLDMGCPTYMRLLLALDPSFPCACCRSLRNLQILLIVWFCLRAQLVCISSLPFERSNCSVAGYKPPPKKGKAWGHLRSRLLRSALLATSW